MSRLNEKVLKGIRNPRMLALYVFKKMCSHRMPDKCYLKTLYRLMNEETINIDKPTTFNEKLNWMKVHLHDPKFTMMADKYAVKDFVTSCIGKEYVVENYAVGDKWEDIDFTLLPNQFILKCTHDSGGAFVCRDKSQFDFDGVRRQVEANLSNNYYYSGREWPYKNIRPRIIVDKFLDDHTGDELRDYKFWCFNGKPLYMYCTIKAKDIYENFYDMEFNPVNINHGFPRHQPEFEKPKRFDLMKDLAGKLSNGLPFVRVDFFEVEGKVYFGEFTFYDWGGLLKFPDHDVDKKLGELIKLPCD